VWLCRREPVEVAEEEHGGAAAAPAAEAHRLLLSPAVAALSSPRLVDPWLAERFSAVRCGPLRVRGGTEGAAACLAELCGDGTAEDPGDAAFVVDDAGGGDGAGGPASSRGAPAPPLPPAPSRARPLVLAGDGPAPLSSSLLAPLLATPHASPPPPPALLGAGGGRGRPPAPTAVFEPAPSPSCSGPPRRGRLRGEGELVLDALALYPKTATAGEAAAALRSALSRQLRAAMAATAAAASSAAPSPCSISPLRACPFLLPGLPVFVTPLMLVPQRKKEKNKGKEKEKEEKEEATCSSSPSSASDAASAVAAAARASLGRALRLPPGLPLLRTSAAFDFVSASATSKTKRRDAGDRGEKLLDVHRSLPSFAPPKSPKPSKAPTLPFEPPLPASPSLSCACVAGSYRYHHYGQDSQDDRGWGCAYRSLQTLWSWFAENHFLPANADDADGGDGGGKGRRRRRSTAPPTHAEIQRALVSVGDKPPTFVGSKQWIGALEISFVLEELAGIQSKVIPVPRGSEMGSPAAAGALVAHFRSQGTPVMVGGGVLAYTCLGCCFDPASGEARFLILDPHYCGAGGGGAGGAGAPGREAAAAAAAVVKGGWVAWKRPGDSAAAGGPLFVDDAFYNLLCPQRPAESV